MQRDIPTEFKELRLSGMAAAWQELTTHEGKYTDVGVQTSRWQIEHLLQAEHAHRAFASVRHQMKAAKFPLPRDLAGFDFEASKIDHKLVKQLSTLEFTETAQNVVLIGGPGTGKTHLATALAFEACCRGKRVAFWRVTELITSLLEAREEKNLLRIRKQLSRHDLNGPDEWGYVPGSKGGGEPHPLNPRSPNPISIAGHQDDRPSQSPPAASSARHLHGGSARAGVLCQRSQTGQRIRAGQQRAEHRRDRRISEPGRCFCGAQAHQVGAEARSEQSFARAAARFDFA